MSLEVHFKPDVQIKPDMHTKPDVLPSARRYATGRSGACPHPALKGRATFIRPLRGAGLRTPGSRLTTSYDSRLQTQDPRLPTTRCSRLKTHDFLRLDAPDSRLTTSYDSRLPTTHDSRFRSPTRDFEVPNVPTCQRANVPTCQRSNVPTCQRSNVPT